MRRQILIGATLLSLVLTFGNMGLACGTGASQTPVSSRISTPPDIPANYATYTDESSVFSISYPEDWETALKSTPFLEQVVRDSLSNMKSGLPVRTLALIFMAGQPAEKGLQPSVIVTVKPVMGLTSTLDGVVATEMMASKLMFQDFREFSRVKTTIDGREVAIIDWEGAEQWEAKKRNLEMIMVINKTTLTVTCSAVARDYTVAKNDFARWKNDFDIIINSFRINVP